MLRDCLCGCTPLEKSARILPQWTAFGNLNQGAVHRPDNTEGVQLSLGVQALTAEQNRRPQGDCTLLNSSELGADPVADS